MTSKTINKMTREAIILALAADVHFPRLRKLEEEEHQLAMDIWDHFFGEAPLDEVPDDLLTYSYGFSVQDDNGNHHSLAFSHTGEFSECYGGVWRRPHADVTRPCPKCYIQAPKKFCRRLKALREGLHEANNDWHNLRNKTWQLLSGCRTTKRLKELWPEGEQYLPKDKGGPGTSLVPTGGTINELIAKLRKAA